MFHLVGIKGAGMSSLACLLHDYGHVVQGSDVSEYFYTQDNLLKRKIKILPFNADNIKKDYIVIVGNAFVNSAEHLQAVKCKCRVYLYHEYIGYLSKSFNSIAVSGTHGKTTTTNMIKQLLEVKEPVNYLIGDGEGGGNSASDFFVFEACEYKRHFLAYHPKTLIITNIDYDHPDYFKDILDVQNAFSALVEQAEKVVYNGDDALVKAIIPEVKAGVAYGLGEENDYYAENISNDHRYTYFDLYYRKKYLGKIRIPLFGTHVVYNALAAIATTFDIINDLDKVKSVLETFVNSKRRFEETLINNQVLISDYAHHPTEIKATLEAVSLKYPYKRIIVYFQPHTYTRTQAFFSEFCESLRFCDQVFLREIFASAREQEKTVSVDDLAREIPNSQVINDEKYLEIFPEFKNCVIVFMGAGDIDRLYAKYREKIQKISNFS